MVNYFNKKTFRAKFLNQIFCLFAEHTTAQNTRSTSQQQQSSSASSSNSANNANLGRQSPYNAATASPSTASISSPAAPQHGVIYQSGKSPNSSASLTTSSSSSGAPVGINLTASTTESGNLKISYEKQSSRVSQIQEQESAPIRRSRLVSIHLISPLLYFLHHYFQIHTN